MNICDRRIDDKFICFNFLKRISTQVKGTGGLPKIPEASTSIVVKGVERLIAKNIGYIFLSCSSIPGDHPACRVCVFAFLQRMTAY
jgi:hypothetical protein